MWISKSRKTCTKSSNVFIFRSYSGSKARKFEKKKNLMHNGHPSKGKSDGVCKPEAKRKQFVKLDYEVKAR